MSQNVQETISLFIHADSIHAKNVLNVIKEKIVTVN